MTAITAADVKLYLSTTAGSAGNANSGTVGNSLGKYVSTSQVSSTALNNLFPDLTGAQNAASQVDYQCFFILNDTASGNSMLNTVVWINSQVSGGATLAIGLDTTAASLKSASAAQALQIANATTAPSGVTFSAAASSGAGLSVGTIPPDFVRAIWVRRTAANSAPLNNDGATIQIDFDTQG